MDNRHKGKRLWWEYIFLIIPLVIFVLLIYYNLDLTRQSQGDSASSSYSFPSSESSETSSSLQPKSEPIASSSQVKSSLSSYSISLNRPIRKPISKEVNIGNQNSKKIALTFDGGASSAQTPSILRILRENNVNSTFFVTGKWAKNNQSIIKQIVDGDHTIGNHTYDHQKLTELTDDAIEEELAMAEKSIKSIVPDITTKPYFRPPYGDRNSHVLEVAGNAGYQSIYWTIDALDWQENATADTVKKRIYENIKNGAIVLMHLGDDITPAILDEVIKKIKNDGYIPVTVDELLAE